MKNDTQPDKQKRPSAGQQLQQDYQQLAHEYRLLSAKYERLKATVLSISQEATAQK